MATSPRVTFTCAAPLGLEEAAALPPGVTVDNGPQGAVVALSLDTGDLAGTLARAVAVGRALPDAVLAVLDLPSADLLPTPLYAAGGATPPRPAAPALPPRADGADDAWELVAARRYDEARAAFAGRALDSTGRDRVRELFQSTDPEEVALACDIAGSTDWRSFVTTMKRVLTHADTRVRVAAVRAIGHLAGPAMTWQLQRLDGDPSPDVRAAVAAAVAEIEARAGQATGG